MSRPRGSRSRRYRQRRRRRRLLLAMPLLLLVLVACAAVVRQQVDIPASISAALLPPTVSPSISPSISPSAGPSSPAPTPVSVPKPAAGAPLLQEPGAVPERGSAKFGYAAGRGKVLGKKGKLLRFRVAVEQGSNEDARAFATRVEKVLGDSRSWIGNGQVRLQRVSDRDAENFTIYLATRVTAAEMCATEGNDIREGSVPYTSCRIDGKVIINLDRWRLSATPYLKAKIPLEGYRDYVINHETGHELGQGHQDCPKAGGSAPVMVQQTLTLRGCVPYFWPRRAGRPLIGAAVA